MRELAILIIAAFLEVGGDALVNWGLKGSHVAGLILGAVILFAYGVTVNAPKWDFGRLLGVYIVIFFFISQAVSIFVFHNSFRVSTLVAGALIASGGIVLTCF